MKKNLVSPQIFIFWYPTLAILVVILISWWLVIPQSRKTYQTYLGLDNKRQKLQILEQKRQILASVDKQTLDTLSELTLALPDEKDPASIMVSLDNLSGKSSLFLDNLEFSPLTADEATTSQRLVQSGSKRPAKTVELSISGRGSPQNFVDFIDQLLGSRRLMDIESMDISFKITEGDMMQLTMNLSAYYLPPLTQIGAVESQLPTLTAEEKQILATIGNWPYLSSPQIATETEGRSEIVGKSDLFAP